MTRGHFRWHLSWPQPTGNHQWTSTWTVWALSFTIWYDCATLYLAFASEILHLMSAQRLGRARNSWRCMDGTAGNESVAHQCEQRRWGKLQWLISQCTKRLVPGSSSARANCGLQFPSYCTLRFCVVVRLSIARPVDDVGSVTKRYENLEGHAILWRFTNHTEEKSSCWLINDDFLDSDAPIIEMSEEKKTYRKKDM